MPIAKQCGVFLRLISGLSLRLWLKKILKLHSSVQKMLTKLNFCMRINGVGQKNMTRFKEKSGLNDSDVVIFD